MALIFIDAGENFIIKRKFYQADGTTPVDIADIKKVTCSLVQNGAKVAQGAVTYTAPNTYSNGFTYLGSGEFKYEITPALSANLEAGDLYALWEIEIANPDFPLNNSTQKSIQEVEIGLVRK